MNQPKAFSVDWRAADVGKVLEQVRAYAWPPAPDVADGWAYGCDARFLKRLCDHWTGGYDWRAAVNDLNRYPQFTARVEDFDLHFVHVVGEAEGRRPLILSHGWP
ncbi:MAG: epoxide hydrolase N-terminal domain-containing protein, partial [Caulobacteraceae bacterium]